MKKYLPVLGIGPILRFPMAIISAIAIFLSCREEASVIANNLHGG